MQQTRQYILEILRERGDATVDELVNALKDRIHHEITAVTIRHHLDILRSEELVTPPTVRRRSTPGRPQHVYALTEKALEFFPNNYQNLVEALLDQVKATLPPPQVNVIMENIADKMVTDAGLLAVPMEARLDQITVYLNQQGYDSHWEPSPEGYILYTRNCPYRQIAGDHNELCGLDFRVVSGLLGVVPRRVSRLVEHDDRCTFLIPAQQKAAQR